MKIKVNSFFGVAAWKWTYPKDDDCGICRNCFDDCCAECKAPGDDCPIIIGKCGHCFHMHCIEEWHNQPHCTTSKLCPMCRQQFETIS